MNDWRNSHTDPPTPGHIVMLILGPILTIWSLNLLFGLSIPVTIKTFFATMWLCMVLGARASFNRS